MFSARARVLYRVSVSWCLIRMEGKGSGFTFSMYFVRSNHRPLELRINTCFSLVVLAECFTSTLGQFDDIWNYLVNFELLVCFRLT